MKRLFLILILITTLFTQCETEKSVQVESPQKELVKKLENDQDFINLHSANNNVASLAFEKLRELGSNAERAKSNKKLEELFKAERNAENLKLIINELGFTEKEFAENLIVISKSKVALEKKYGASFLTRLDSKEISSVITKIETNNPLKFKTSKFRDRIRVCTNCPFNNCDECSGGEGGGSDGGYNSEDEAGGVGGSCNEKCLQGAQMKRDGARHLAQIGLAGATLACQQLAVNTFGSIVSATWYTAIFGPEAPLVFGIIGGGVVDAGCMLSAIWTYRSAIQVVEGDYILDKAGCGC